MRLPHHISVITNIDIEHLDYYKNEENIINAFESFILNLPFDGFSIVCFDNKYLKKLIKKIKTRNLITYSIKDKKADIFIKDINNNNNFSFFTIKINKRINGYIGIYKFKIKLLGDHNILNGSASIIASLLAGVKINTVKKSLLNYHGVKRRFIYIGKKKKALIYDDYAHHPTEIKATYLAAKKITSNIVVVFQPHRYTRTNYLMSEFINVLSKIKKIYILRTYSAGEKLIKGATSKDIVINLLKKNKHSTYIHNERNLYKFLNKHTTQKKLIIFMGAGSISKIAHDFIDT